MDVITISSGEEDNTSPGNRCTPDVDVKPDVHSLKQAKVPDVAEKVKKSLLQKVPDVTGVVRMSLFAKFLESCKSYLKKEDVSPIVNKIRKIHDHAAKVYTDSVEFKLLLKRKLKDISCDPQNVYIHVKEVADELKLRKLKKIPPSRAQNGEGVSNGHVSGNVGTSAADDRSLIDGLTEVEAKHVKKLTKVMRLLSNKIKVLETKEVDFDEENDSSYMRLQRYRERFCKVREKLSQYIPEMNVRRQRVSFPVHTHPELYRHLENLVNKTKQFPDYHDVLKAVIECKISSVAEENQTIARQAFEVIGNELQKRRQYEDWVSMSSFLESERDPALDSPDLEEQLKSNQEDAKSKISLIINQFVERETESKLEPKEVGEAEAELSAGEGSGQEDEEEIKNMEEDVDEEDIPDDDAEMPDSPNSIASAPDSDDVVVEKSEPRAASSSCATSPQIDPRFLRPVSPPVWEEYYSLVPPREDGEQNPVVDVDGARDGMLRRKRSLTLARVNSPSPKKMRTESGSISVCSSMAGNTTVDTDVPTTILLD